jgi:hypothetical protein
MGEDEDGGSEVGGVLVDNRERCRSGHDGSGRWGQMRSVSWGRGGWGRAGE